MSELKKICIVTQHFLPDNQAMVVRMKYLADAINESGIQVKVLTSRKSSDVKEYSVEAVWTPVASNKDGVYFRLIKELVFATEVFFRLLFDRSQLFIITSPPFTIGFFGALACWVSGKPYVYDVRDEYPEVYFVEGLIKEKSWLGRMLINIESSIYKRSILTTTVTERIKGKLKIKSGSENKIYLLRNGFADAIQFVENQPVDKFIILFHGNMGKFQQPELLCEVAALCQADNLPVEFHVYGWGNKSSIIVEGQSRLSNVKHQGELPHHQMTSVIKNASLGVSFQGNTEISRNSFPSKVMEFIASGIPVIVTPISEAGDFVEKEQVGFQFEVDQANEIYLKIKQLIANPESMREMKSRGFLLRKELSRNSVSKKFVSHLRDEWMKSSNVNSIAN